MAKHSDWSGVTDILGRAASELRREVTGIAQERTGDARANLASAVDGVASRIRRGAPHTMPMREHRGLGALPLLVGIGTLVGVAALFATDRQNAKN